MLTSQCGSPVASGAVGDFSRAYCRAPSLVGMGFSSSSVHAVLCAARADIALSGRPLDQRRVARVALRYDRAQAGGARIAAQDDYPIALGGVMKVITEPDRASAGGFIEGSVEVEPVAFDKAWVAEHMVVACNPTGRRHSAPDLLGGLLSDADEARARVAEFSLLAAEAARGIARKDLSVLAAAVNSYRQSFDAWQRGRYVEYVVTIARAMNSELNEDVAGWKLPGAGGCESLLVLTAGGASTSRALTFFRKRRWWASPVHVTHGVRRESGGPGGRVVVSAGHRLDLVGASDLGQDALIGLRGVCCACAMAPRVELALAPPAGPEAAAAL